MNLLRFAAPVGANVYATFVQAVGLWMFGFLLFILARAVRRDWFDDFAKSFIFLAVAVSSLRVAFALGNVYGRPFFFVYFLGEYLFLYFVALGAGRLAAVATPGSSRWLIALVAILTAFALSGFRSFSEAFVVQAAIMAAGLFRATAFAFRKPLAELPGFGLVLLRISLFVLAVGFAQYVPILGLTLFDGRSLPEIYAAFMPVFDLLFEALLACAMIVTGMESVQRQLVDANRTLEGVTLKLDVLARTDPLTELMNRHAFAAVLETSTPEPASGSVAVIDIDGLKAINDAYGHQAGDLAIRTFAHALRTKLRSDDLIFRWGGDEFLVVMFGFPPDEIATRLGSVGNVDVPIEGVHVSAQVGASFGVAAFASLGGLRQAAAIADAAMYEEKRARARLRLSES
jgi:diguanylate cyclase (GGDEF)-like protein